MTLTAPEHIRGRLGGLGLRRRQIDRVNFVRNALASGYSTREIAAALNITHQRILESCKTLIEDAARKPTAPINRAPRDVIHVAGQAVSVPPLPWEITPDPRHDTAPRRRGLIGGHVVRDDAALLWELGA